VPLVDLTDGSARLKQLREESAIESKSGQAHMNKMDMEQEPAAEGGVEMVL
jgi:hypothetical protein